MKADRRSLRHLPPHQPGPLELPLVKKTTHEHGGRYQVNVEQGDGAMGQPQRGPSQLS